MRNENSVVPRKKPKQARSRMTVEAILIATAHILVEEGYEAANTNHIAEVAGVSIGSLYQYFPGKRAIIAALIEQHALKMMDVIEKKLSSGKGEHVEVILAKLVQEVVQITKADNHLHRLLIEQIPDPFHLEQVTPIKQRIESLIRSYLEKKTDEVQTDDVALSAFMFFNALVMFMHEAAVSKTNYLNHKKFEQELTYLISNYLKSS